MKARRGAIQLELSDFSIYLLLLNDTQKPRERFFEFFGLIAPLTYHEERI
jgi:hypothetical protein